MNLITEYENQNKWRNWERYLNKLPLNKNQIVYDLGCSIGVVSKLLSNYVQKVVGYDNNKVLLEKAIEEKNNKCEFVLENIFNINTDELEKCDGIWMSFILAYVENPEEFIKNWTKCLNENGWIAIVDIDNLFSSHLKVDNKYFEEVKAFEEASYRSKTYDFNIGSKIKDILIKNGLEVIVEENNWYDDELNFIGSANEAIISNWKSRLDRMINLKLFLGDKYEDFANKFLAEISRNDHISHGGVKFYIGIKK